MNQASEKLPYQHVAALVRSQEEEYEVLRSYITEGIDAGERAIHICNPDRRGHHRRQLETMGVQAADLERIGQLELMSWGDAYLKNGRFDSDKMMALLDELVNTSLADGFRRVRLLGYMDWAAVESYPGIERLIEYEAKVNDLLQVLKQPAICVYDVNKFSGSIITDLLRTHPYVILDGVLRQNPFYIPPEEFFGAH